MFEHSIAAFLLLVVLIAKKIPPDRYSDDTNRYEFDNEFQSRSVKLSPSLQFILTMQINSSKQKGPICRKKLVLLYLCMLLLQESFAPEPNPGPRAPKFPCGVCNKAVKWSTPGVQCDNCSLWYHQVCMGMGDHIYLALNNVSWECLHCGLPNFSSCLFDLTLYETSNSYDTLQTDTSSLSDISFNHPRATSSPHRVAPTSRAHSLSDTSYSVFSVDTSLTHPSLSAVSNEIHQISVSSKQRTDIPMKLLVLNCQSIVGKTSSLAVLSESTNADIIIGSESWLSANHFNSELFPSHYQVYRRDRKKSRGGGVFILVHSRLQSLSPEELQTDDDCEMIWTQITAEGSNNLYVGAFYRPPNVDNPEYLSCLDTCLSRIPDGAHVWLGGDFNLPDIDWETCSVKPSASKSTLCQQLLDITNNRYLEQQVQEPTRITESCSNTLDLFFTNNPTLVSSTKVIPGISDHEVVYVEASLRPHLSPSVKRKVLLHRKADCEGLKEGFRQLHEEISHMQNTSVDSCWDRFKKGHSKLIEEHIPSKMLRDGPKKKPWIDKKVRSSLRKKVKLYSRMKRSNKDSDISAYKKHKAATQQMERQAYQEYVNNIIEVEDPDAERQPKQKRFWSYVKSLRKDNSGISPLKDRGHLFNSPKDKADILNKQYMSVFTHESNEDIPEPTGTPVSNMKTIEIKEEGILKLLHNINPKKAAGPDNISARIMKEYAPELTPILTCIFNHSLKEGKVPDDWRHANVTAIYKKGARHDPANYRPVSLTSLCCKLLEHIIVSQMQKHLDSHNVLHNSQHGFRARRSCETALLTLQHDLASSLDKGIQTDMGVLDFSKAFDRVPHQRLLKKINHYGIRGQTYSWIKSFLENRTQQVLVEGQASDVAPVVSGVPQGSVLGPLLFLLFINDLPEVLSPDTKCKLFADDCILYRQIRSDLDQHQLQQDLEALTAWEKKWGMSFHPQKCSVLRVTRSRTPRIFNYALKGVTLATELSTKYLGVDLQADLGWRTHIDRVTKKANSMLGFIKRNLKNTSQETKTNAYNALVRSNLEYCSSVWSPHHKILKNKVEMVQRRAARFVTSRYRNTSSVSDMLRELKWEPLGVRRQKIQLTMFFKIVNNLVDIDSSLYLHPAKTLPRSPHNTRFVPYQSSTDSYKFSFFPRSIPYWNTLPASIAEAHSLASFKSGLSNYTF